MELSVPEAPVSLWMDKDKIDKIFDNLLSNAVKYTPVGGTISITIEQNDKKITVEVKDSGIGIPRKAQRYIFSNFYRAENAVNSKETGSGIGLLLTRRLMKLHKGNISFTSNEGEGSTFLEMVGVEDRFGQVGAESFLREEYGLTAAHIVEAAKKAIARKNG